MCDKAFAHHGFSLPSRFVPASAAALLVMTAALLPAAVEVKQKDGNWHLENDQIQVVLAPQTGLLSVREKPGWREWKQAPTRGASADPRFANIHPVAQPAKGVAFDWAFGPGGTNSLLVTLTLINEGADLFVEADMVDRTTKIDNIFFLEPFVLDTPGAVLVVADYCNGHLYPLDLKPLPRTWFSLWEIDMPWVGICDLKQGFGYAIIVETADDALIRMTNVKQEGRELSAPQVGWAASKKEFRYPRRFFYHFASAGGYVALAKRYRAYAQEQGLIVPFTEKLKKNSNVARIFGAPDVWGDASLPFARAAKEAGVEKMIIHGRTSAEGMKAVNELGYLTSTYDNYTDIFQVESGKEIDAQHGQIPGDVVLKADGQRMTAWLTWDKKQYMKRCPALWVEAAQLVVPKDLAQRPYLGRFIDVTTAEGLYECYDKKHPLTRSDKRACGDRLLSYVRSLGLVTGGEHGRHWAVPHLDYIEGMMSGGSYSWPAGHLTRPKSKDQEFTSPWGHPYDKWDNYEKWGIGHAFRVPLWELVFHDCIVSTWYWGDASDFLLQAAPEVTPKKDAFNVLYGTIPIMWANKEGSWPTAREVFLRSYRNTCKLHEAIATADMVSHDFITPDRAVQQTRFSDGTQVIVNFGEPAYKASLAGKDYLLPQNGFAVKGPRIEQSLTLVEGKRVTSIRTDRFHYEE
jgi:hypothetical protein